MPSVDFQLTDDSTAVPLRAFDFDWSGAVNNSVYLQLFEQGRWNWARRNGITDALRIFTAVVADAKLAFHAPIRWDPTGEVNVQTQLQAVTAFSFTVRQTVRYCDTVAARGILRLAVIDAVSHKLLRVDQILAKHALSPAAV